MAGRAVSTDKEAWALLESWLAGESIERMVFKGWPVLSIKLNGEDYQSSLSSSQMSALVDLKNVFARGYTLPMDILGEGQR